MTQELAVAETGGYAEIPAATACGADESRELRKELGRGLRTARLAAGYAQSVLARKLGYTRSAVSNAESGGYASRDFWQRCDELLHTGGTLTAGYDKIREISLAAQAEHFAVPETGRESPAVKVAVGFRRGTWHIEIILPKENPAGHADPGPCRFGRVPARAGSTEEPATEERRPKAIRPT